MWESVVRDDLGDFEVKKTLSVKVPINKEDFGFVDEFLVDKGLIFGL